MSITKIVVLLLVLAVKNREVAHPMISVEEHWSVLEVHRAVAQNSTLALDKNAVIYKVKTLFCIIYEYILFIIHNYIISM